MSMSVSVARRALAATCAAWLSRRHVRLPSDALDPGWLPPIQPSSWTAPFWASREMTETLDACSRKLSGRWHHVLSGIALICRDQKAELARVSSTRVRFREMAASEIRWYVATGEPSDKAGAYAIQGKGGLFIERIAGSPSNVVGFPLEAFYDLLQKASIKIS